MIKTLADFLNQDVDELIKRNVGLAAMFKATLTHACDQAEKDKKPFVEIGFVKCDSEGDCHITISYSRTPKE